MGDNSIYKICKHINEECYSNDSQGTGHYLSPGGGGKKVWEWGHENIGN